MVPGLCFIHRTSRRAVVCVVGLADDSAFFVHEDGTIELMRWKMLFPAFMLVGIEEGAASYSHTGISQLRQDAASGVFIHALALTLSHGRELLHSVEL